MWHPTPKDHNLNSRNHESLTFCPQILKTSKVTASYTVMFLIKHLLIWLVNCHTLLSAKNLCFSHITVNTWPCSTSGLSCSNRGTWCSGQAGGQDTAGGFVFWSLNLYCKQTPIKVIIKCDCKLLWWQLWRSLSSRMWCHVVWWMLLQFWRNLLPLSIGQKIQEEYSSEMSVNFYQNAQNYIPEDSNHCDITH